MENEEIRGLTSQEVETLVKEGKTNKTKKHVTKTYPRIILDNCFNFFNILLFSIFALMVYAGLPWTSFFFMLVLIPNMIIGLIQDINARRLVDKLRLVTDPKAKVIRDGEQKEIATKDVVLGDVIKLDIGDQICADSIIVSGSVSCDESMLTGESVPVAKKEGDHLYSASFITKGHCYAKTEKVGADNYAETLQKQASFFKRPKSEIQRSIKRIFLFTGCMSLFIGAITTISAAINYDLTDPVVFQKFVVRLSGNMISMVPAGLYLLSSLTLAVGVVLLARRHMLVQELYCIEMLARVDVLCLDKTGTLTDGRMAVEDIVGISSKEEVERALALIAHGTGDTNGTAKALLERFTEKPEGEILASIPFDSATKRSAVSIEGCTYVMGAYGFVEAKTNEKAEKEIEEHSNNGSRVIAVYKNENQIANGNIVGESELIGYAVLSDHIKDDAAKNIEWFKKSGVSIRIISGDSPITVANIAKRVGVEGADKYVSCEGLSDEKLTELVKDHYVFGRVSPEQKETLVKALQAQGHSVGMTGDGVNDILALKAADCSIAMASGSDAAKNVSHLVSMNNDFSNLPDVVDQGRRVINNLQRTCSLFLSKTFFAITLGIAFLIAEWCGGYAYPFTTNNMYPWEIITIGIAAFFLALQPSHDKLKGSFLRNILLKAIPAGIGEVCAVLLAFIASSVFSNEFRLPEGVVAPENAAFKTLAILSFTLVSIVVLFKVCTPFNKYRTIVFVGAVGGVVALLLVDFFTGGKLVGCCWSFDETLFSVIAFFVIALSGGLYYLVEFVVRKLEKKFGKGDLQ